MSYFIYLFVMQSLQNPVHILYLTAHLKPEWQHFECSTTTHGCWLQFRTVQLAIAPVTLSSREPWEWLLLGDHSAALLCESEALPSQQSWFCRLMRATH